MPCTALTPSDSSQLCYSHTCQTSHRAILEGDECPAAAWEEVQALCWTIPSLQAVQRLLLAHVPNLQDACMNIHTAQFSTAQHAR
jgi:hypothetical protein